jgi:thiamine biosynthesis lipoprotein
MSFSFSALGTTALVLSTDEAALAPAVACVRAEVEAFDRVCSRFRSDSELSRLNAANGRGVFVGPLLREAIATALAAAAASDGAVDPTVGPALVALGYDEDFQVVSARADSTPSPPEPAVGWHQVRLDQKSGFVRLPAGTALDLGATAKALCADRAAQAAALAMGCGVLVSLGGDIAVAGPAPEGGWRVRINDDHRDLESPGPVVGVRTGGLATSSTTVRRWHAGTGYVHHIVDPRSGRSAAGPWRLATVTAASCVAANTAATAALVHGQGALGWLESQSLPARLVGHDGVVAYSGDWPRPG